MKREFFVAAIVLSTVIWLVYGRAIDAPLVFDDSSSVETNVSIRQLWPLWDSQHAGPLHAPDNSPMAARPLVNLSLALNYHFSQLDPRGYHVANLVMHTLAALLLWAIVRRTLRLDFFAATLDRASSMLALGAALIWAVHPLATETVQYITQRTELMMGLCYLTTLYAALRYWAAPTRSRRAAWLLLTALGCAAGMLCKEMMVTAPAMMLLYDRTFIAGSFRKALRTSWPLYISLTASWTGLLLIYACGRRTPQSGFGLGVSPEAWWFTQCKVLLMYLKLAIVPWPLSIHYEIPYLETFSQAWPWVAAVALGLLGAIVLLWRRSAVGFVAAWVVIVLSPTLVVPLVSEVAAERRMYVPLMALAPLAVVGGYVLVRRATERGWVPLAKPVAPDRAAGAVTVVTVLGVAVVFGVLSASRLEAYEEELTLWEDALAHQPDNWLAHVNFGIQLKKTGRHEEALEHFERAVQLQPDSLRAHYNLGLALEEAGRGQEAIEHYEQALRLNPDWAAAHTNLGGLLADRGQVMEAIRHYELALQIDPGLSQAHNNLGFSLVALGKPQDAIPHFEEAMRLRPSAETCLNLAGAYALTGQRTAALARAQQALNLAHAEGQTALADQIEMWIKQFAEE